MLAIDWLLASSARFCLYSVQHSSALPPALRVRPHSSTPKPLLSARPDLVESFTELLGDELEAWLLTAPAHLKATVRISARRVGGVLRYRVEADTVDGNVHRGTGPSVAEAAGAFVASVDRADSQASVDRADSQASVDRADSQAGDDATP